ncbi:MAG TPA: ribosome assembly RNA-binding protein YhbY [Rubrivivax sp.]
MPALSLTTSERRQMRADAHHLDPVVHVGGDGLTPAVLKEADAALNAHGLIKVRVFSDTREERESLLAALVEALSAAPVQHIGKLLVVWRPIPPKVKAERDDRMPGPRTVKLVSFSKSGNHRATVKKVKLFGNQRVAAGGAIKRTTTRQVSAKKKAQGQD